jgi:BioD-like phosphotransacetylase family protein
MKALYITSIENWSGKTAICLAIGKRLQAEGYKVGYLKPVSYQPAQLEGHVVDEDATFVRNVLSLDVPAWDLSPVVVTPNIPPECLEEEDECQLRGQIQEAFDRHAAGKDVILLEGGASLREGYVLNLSPAMVAEMLDAIALVVVKYHGRMQIMDDALTARFRLGDRLLGVIFNRVPEQEMDFIQKRAIPFLTQRGVQVLGALPERAQLSAISVGELAESLSAKFITGENRKDALIESLMVGAMGAQEALSRFRVHQNKAVITGGDRTDIQLAALDTSTVCLVLTGNLRPAVEVVERAAERGVAILVVPTNTMETVEAIDRVYGKTRLGQAEKLAHFEALMAQNVDYKQLFSLLGL